MRVCPWCDESYETGTYSAHRLVHVPVRHKAPTSNGHPKVERNADIIRRVEAGESAAEVARSHGITRERVRQIWKRTTGRPIPHIPAVILPRACDACDRPYLAGHRKEHAASVTHRLVLSLRREVAFWSKVRKTETCWIWTGTINRVTGYGNVSGSRERRYAHRLAYEYAVGPIPVGLTIDHLCRVRACVNPTHLEVVTQRENILRSPIARAAINARKTHCLRGHAFDEVNTLIQRDGGRRCRRCVVERRLAA